VWIIFLVFKGNDLHSGFSPRETKQAHQEWVESQLLPAWDVAGPENRMGFVIYPSRPAIEQSAAMNMTPAQMFGNFGAAQPHKLGQLNFATHGQVILGGKDVWAHRLGQELVASFWNQLQYCDLDLNIDPNILLQLISYTDKEGAVKWYRAECAEIHIPMERSDFCARQEATRIHQSTTNVQEVFNAAERCSFNASVPKVISCIDIEKVVTCKIIDNRVRVF
jgi:hypothetical protein